MKLQCPHTFGYIWHRCECTLRKKKKFDLAILVHAYLCQRALSNKQPPAHCFSICSSNLSETSWCFTAPRVYTQVSPSHQCLISLGYLRAPAVLIKTAHSDAFSIVLLSSFDTWIVLWFIISPPGVIEKKTGSLLNLVPLLKCKSTK